MRILLVLAIALAAITADAARAKKNRANLSTNHQFSSLSIHGKHNEASEALVTVEKEKPLQDLLGFRKEFKDRQNQMSQGQSL